MSTNPSKPYSIPRRYLNGLSTAAARAVMSALSFFEARNQYLKPFLHTTIADAAATLTVANLFDQGCLSMTTTTARAITLPSSAAIIAALCPDGYRLGASAEFTWVTLAAYAATITAGDGSTTIIGSAVVDNASGTFRIIVTSGTTVKLIRK